MTRTCPKCHANLDSVHVRDGKIRCPQCKALLALGRPRTDDILEALPAAGHRPAKIEREPSPSRRVDKEHPIRPKSKPNSLPAALILLGVGLGLFVLLALGGVAALLYFHQPAAVAPATSAKSEAAQPTVPVAQLDPGPAKEPIQPAPPALVREKPASLDPDALRKVKQATVYLRVDLPNGSAAEGSGFL